MRAVDKFIIHVTHNLFPLNEYSEGEINKLMAKFKEEADDLEINITDDQLKAYIERFDSLKNSPKITEKDLRKYSLSKLIKLVTSSKGVAEPEEEMDTTPDVVYDQNGLIIYNGSKEENCLNFGRGESWCITRGSFGNYRYDDNRKNPTFYLVKDTNLPSSDRKSFFVVVVGSDNTYKASDRSNNDVGGRATEWDRWEPWGFIESNFPSITGLRSVFKYIPLSSKEKLNQSYKNKPTTFREWSKLPFDVKEQYLVVRKGRQLFQDISNDDFIEKHLSKYPQIASTISTNAGIIDSVTLVKNLEKFSNQDVKSIMANMRDKIPLEYLSTEAITFEVKKFLVKFDKFQASKSVRLYVTKDGEGIVKLTLDGNDISIGLYTEEDDYPKIKLNKRTSKYLLEYPDLDKIPFKTLVSLSSEDIIDKSVVNSVLDKAKSDPNSALVVKETEDGNSIILDSNTFSSYKMNSEGKVNALPFTDEEVQKVFASQSNNEGFQQNALTLITPTEPIPQTIDKDSFVSVLKSIPLNKRTVNWRGMTGVILIPEGSSDTVFFIMDPNRGVTNLTIDALFSDRNNWRRPNERTTATDPQVYKAYYDYLRSTSLAYSDERFISTLKNISGYGSTGFQARKAAIAAQPPMAAGSIYRPVIAENGMPYIINTQNSRLSFTVSESTGKLLKANLSSAQAARILGVAPQAQAAGQPTTGRRGRPAGVANTPRPQQAATPAAAGDIVVPTEMENIGLDAAFMRLPRAIFRRLNVDNASRVDPNGDRGAARRNNILGTAGRVGRVISVGASKIYIIRLANQQIIASINVQPGNYNYVLTGNESGNNAISLNSPADLLNALQQRGLAEAHQYIVNEYLENNPGHIKEFKELLRKHINEKKNAN